MKPKSDLSHCSRTLFYLLAAALLWTTTGCNALNELEDLKEIEQMLSQMQYDSLYAPPLINSIKELAPATDSIKTGIVTIDSLPHNSMQTTIRKVKLDGHDYWTITAMGYNMGGAGITHSESCWCKRIKTFNGIELPKPSTKSTNDKHPQNK